MTNRDATYRRNHKDIDWSGVRQEKRIKAKPKKRMHEIMSEISAFVSPIDQSVISSRRQLREHERVHNVRQSGNDWTGSKRPEGWGTV
jgi:hypothetical protein